MTNFDRQISLETKMYKHKTFGKEEMCNYCWAKCKGCIHQYRTQQLACVKAECRMTKIPFRLREMIYSPSRQGFYYGFKGDEL
jgi:hypothetical protein